MERDTRNARRAAARIMAQRNTAADRFAMAARRLREQRGGRPTASIVNGRIVFTYPDGTVTGDQK